MFSAIFIRRPRFALVISIFLVLAGLLCYNRLPVAEYPQVSPPTIMVMAFYPGASSQVIADTIAAPLESEVNGIEDMIYYSSQSDNNGNYTLLLTFESGCDEDMALVNVNNAVKLAESKLPAEVVKNGIIVVKRSSDMLGLLTFYSDNPEHDIIWLSNYVSNNVKDSIARIDGVGQAVIFGALDYSIRVWLDPHKMQAYSISEAEVMGAINSQNIQAATGAVGTESSSKVLSFKVDTQGRLSTPEEFGNIVVRSGDDGRQVRLADISANIELGAENYASPGKYKGKEAVVMAIFKLSDANAVEMMENIRAELTELEKKFPEGVKWEDAYDTTEFIEVTMAEIIETLLITFALVVLITWIFLQDWRATIIPTVTIPVSLIGTFFFMYLLDMSINVLTMFALILVIGSVVDDAICVTENCTRLIDEEGLSPFDAAMKTMQQLTGALIATTLVVVAIYVPLMFYGGMVGTIYIQFAVTMCIALCLSTVNALTLSPALCTLILRKSKTPRGLFKVFNIGLNWARNGYLAVGGMLVRRLLLTGILFAVILFMNWYIFKDLPTAFLPAEDKGALLCDVMLAPGTSLVRTNEVLDEISGEVKTIPGVEFVLTVPGRSLTAGEGDNMGLMIVDLDHWDQRQTPDLHVTAIQQEMMKRCAAFPDATVNAFVPPAIMGLGETGGVTFALQYTGESGGNKNVNGMLVGGAWSVIGDVMQSGKAVYGFTTFEASTPMLYLDIDRQKAEAMKVPVNMIFTTLQSQLGSIYVNDFNKDGKIYQVKIQIDPKLRNSADIIEQLSVTSTDGNTIPLSVLVTPRWVVGPRQVERFNMFPAASINVQSVPGVSSGEMMQDIEQIVNEKLGKDFSISWKDLSYQERNNDGKIVALLMISLLVAYLFLVAQYESWTMPVSVMLSVATATLGAMIALKLTGIALDIYCQLGLLMLIGLVAKTAILMVEFSKQERENGKSIEEAAMNGMKVRFRSVMMTALSFVIGVFPLVIASGAGAGSRRSVGVTTFWGMLIATTVGMMFIPGLYVIFQKSAEKVFGIFRRRGELPKNE